MANDGNKKQYIKYENTTYELVDGEARSKLAEVEKAVGKELNILVLGNSFSQDSFAYLPPVLNELLPGYNITYGVAYTASCGAIKHMEMYNNDQNYDNFWLWRAGADHWSRYAGSVDAGYSLREIMPLREWDIVYMQSRGSIAADAMEQDMTTENITPGRELLRVLQNGISHNFTFLTGQWLSFIDQTTGDTLASYFRMRKAIKYVADRLGVDGVIPIGAGIAFARMDSDLDDLGEAGHLLYDSHQQAGLPALISTYVIAQYILEMLGREDVSVYGSTFVPNLENATAINATNVDEPTKSMTHGSPVGVTAANILKAQEIAVAAAAHPDSVYGETDQSEGGSGAVTSVNGKTGVVVLDASDVGALPSNTPIPSAVTEHDVAEWGFTKNTGTYSKPSGGIPKSDLDQAVQTSLGKADTALQAHQSLAAYRTSAAQDTIDASKANTADLAAVATSGSYNDLSDKPTIPTVPTAEISANTAARHKHSNKALLDTYAQTETNLADAVSKKHSHSNKAVLDDITAEKVQSWDAKPDDSDFAEVAFSGDYNDLRNRPGENYIFADEIPQNADHSAKYVLPDGYIYVYGEHTYHRVYNAATGGLLNKVPGLNQNVNYADDQPGAFLSAPIPWDSSWTQYEKTPTIIRISGIEQLVPVKWDNAIQIWYYKTDGSFKHLISQQNIHSFVGGTPSVGDSIDLPCEFNMADNNFYPLEGTGYVRVWLGVSADGAITADDVKDVVIHVPFYDEDVTATEWYNSGERYVADPQVQQNTEDIADLDTRVTALEEDSGSGGDISVSTKQVLYAVGDSITRGAAAGGEDYAWPKHVIDINGYDATNSVNLGQNGLGFDTAATSSGDTVKTIVDRTDFSGADIVTVALGANDWKNSAARLENVWANMEYCFNKIRTDNPYCKLFYILPFNMSFLGSFSTFYCLSAKGDSNKLCPYAYTLMEYINMIKDKLSTPTFQAFRINVIDMVECAAINRQNITTALADQVHPTAATQAELGKEIARRIVLADGAGGVLPVYNGGVT